MTDGRKPIYKKRGFWAVIVGLIIIGYVGQDSEEAKVEINNVEPVGSEEPTETMKPKENDLELQGEIELEEQNNFKYFIGVVKNNSNKEYRRVRAVVTLYDKDGHQLGHVSDTIYDFEAKNTWKFKAAKNDLKGEVASWKLKEIVEE